MPSLPNVSGHYARGDLLTAIRCGLESLGKAPDSVTIDDLAPVDEFHIGGRQASEHFLGQLNFTPEMHILDVGCGLGGAARFVASRYGSRVSGVDLTPDFITAARTLCRWVGLQDRICLYQANALCMDFCDSAFDGAYMLHVGMNIADKNKLCAEVSRVLRTGSCFGVYDVMRVGEGDLAYPVPWATTADTSAVAEPARYREALQASGFQIVAEQNRRDFAVAFFDRLRVNGRAARGPPPLGLHIPMGTSTPEKVNNMIENISTGRIAPVEMIAQKI